MCLSLPKAIGETKFTKRNSFRIQRQTFILPLTRGSFSRLIYCFEGFIPPLTYSFELIYWLLSICLKTLHILDVPTNFLDDFFLNILFDVITMFDAIFIPCSYSFISDYCQNMIRNELDYQLEKPLREQARILWNELVVQLFVLTSFIVKRTTVSNGIFAVNFKWHYLAIVTL